MAESAFVSEIYASVQGEGLFTGERQIFVRLAGCPLRCRFCDTPRSLTAQGHPRMSVDEVIAKIRALGRRVKTVSVTGGEPLVQAPFVAALFRELKKRGFKTYLETAGIHAAALKRAQRYTDVVSMDIKLPSAVGRQYWEEHRAFLKIAGKKAIVKIVWEAASQLSELKKALALLRARPQPPLLILQVVSPVDAPVRAPAPQPPTADHIADAYALAAAQLPRVLVMSQQHKAWGVR
jgi:organic radical activating enzyme